jgi:D-alanine-D-alanine ligase-like ATP-grasp enzyme
MKALSEWFQDNNIDIDSGRVVVKPARGGSSMGVSVANGMESAVRKAQALITEVMFDNANQNASNMMLSDSSCAWMGCSLIHLYLLICVVLCCREWIRGL